MVDEVVAIEAPVNIFINDEYVITLLSTPKFKKELAIGWLYDEGVLESMNQLKQISITKMNWNSADFCISEPITLAYSREVGRILAYVPEEVIPRPEYRFYMWTFYIM